MQICSPGNYQIRYRSPANEFSMYRITPWIIISASFSSKVFGALSARQVSAVDMLKFFSDEFGRRMNLRTNYNRFSKHDRTSNKYGSESKRL